LCERHSLELFGAMMAWLDLGSKTGEAGMFDRQVRVRPVTIDVKPAAKPAASTVVEDVERRCTSVRSLSRCCLDGRSSSTHGSGGVTFERVHPDVTYMSTYSTEHVAVSAQTSPRTTAAVAATTAASARETPDNVPFSRVDPARGGRAEMGTTIALLLAGVPESTRRAYAADRRCWASWTASQQLPVLPMHGDDLARYTAHLLTVGSTRAAQPRPLKAVTAERRLAALTVWSIERGLPRPDLRPARLVVRGYRRTVRDDPPAQAAPLTVPVLRQLLEQAGQRRDAQGQPTLRALRDRTVLLVGFALGTRRSELVALDLQSFRLLDRGLIVQVLRAKTTTTSDELVIPFASDPDLCPVRAFDLYRDALAERGVLDGPVFRPITRTDVPLARRLSPEAVADIVKVLTEQAGVRVPQGFRGWSGHSLRRGMATEARPAGADSLRIARQGGWADGSAALARYLVDADRWVGHPLQDLL
jgi:integrase